MKTRRRERHHENTTAVVSDFELNYRNIEYTTAGACASRQDGGGVTISIKLQKAMALLPPVTCDYHTVTVEHKITVV